MKSDSDAFKQLSTQACATICQKIGMVKAMGVEDMTRLIKMLSAGPMLDVDKAVCCEAVNARSEERAGVPAVMTSSPEGRVVLQEHHSLHEYLTEVDWSVLLNPDTALQIKLHRVVSRACCLGGLRPGEPAVAKLGSIALCTQDKWQSMAPPAMLQVVREGKAILKSITAGGTKDIQQGPQTYPMSPADFKAHHASAYAIAYSDGEPVPCKIDVGELLQLQSIMPCRATKAGCRMAVPSARMGGASSSAAQFAMAIGNMVMQQMGTMPGFPGGAFVPGVASSASQSPLPTTMALPSTTSLFALADKNSPPQEKAESSSPPEADNSAKEEVVGASLAEASPVAPTPANPPKSISEMVMAMQEQLQPRGGGSASVVVRKRPAACVIEEIGEEGSDEAPGAGKLLALGCSKCRFSKKGCAQCQKPSFGGRRLEQ